MEWIHNCSRKIKQSQGASRSKCWLDADAPRHREPQQTAQNLELFLLSWSKVIGVVIKRCPAAGKQKQQQRTNSNNETRTLQQMACVRRMSFLPSPRHQSDLPGVVVDPNRTHRSTCLYGTARRECRCPTSCCHRCCRCHRRRGCCCGSGATAGGTSLQLTPSGRQSGQSSSTQTHTHGHAHSHSGHRAALTIAAVALFHDAPAQLR